jgi:hypothetical protein
MRSTQTREYNWGATWKEKVAAPVYKANIMAVGDPVRWLRDTILSVKVGTNFTDKLRSLGRYSSLVDLGLGVLLGWSGTESTITEATTGLLYQPRMTIDEDECGAIDGMIGKGNGSTRRKPTQVPLFPPQIPHNLTRARTQTAAVGSRRLTAWPTERLLIEMYVFRRNIFY